MGFADHPSLGWEGGRTPLLLRASRPLGHYPDLWRPQSGLSHRLCKGLFVNKRTDILERRMQANRVVEAFQVLKDSRAGLRLGLKVGVVHALAFEFVKERLHSRIVASLWLSGSCSRRCPSA